MKTDLIAQEEAATILRVNRVTLWRWQKERQILPEIRVGNRPLYKRRDVEAYARKLEESRKQRAAA